MRVRIILEAEFVNFNPPDVYDPSAHDLEAALGTLLQQNRDSFWLDTEKKSGVFHRDLFPSFDARVEVTG